MSLPSHEQIMASLKGQPQQSKVPPVIPTKNIVAPVTRSFDESPMGILSNTITGIPKAAWSSAKFVADELTKRTMNIPNVLKKQFDPRGLTYVGPDGKLVLNRQKAEELAMPAIGAIGEGGNVVKTVSSKLVNETSVPAVKGVLKKFFKNLSDETIELLAPRIAKSKRALEIEKMIMEGDRALPTHEAILKQLSSKEGSAIRSAEAPPENVSKQAIQKEIPKVGTEIKIPGKPLVSSPILPEARQSAVDSLASKESTTELLQKSIVKGDKTGTINPDVGGVMDSLKNAKTSVLEFLQNSEERVRQMVNKPGVQVTDSADPYLKMTLSPGRVGARMEAAKNEVKDIILDLKNTKVSRQELSDYLQARHAPERNAALGDGAAGVTTKEAGERLAQFEAGPNIARIQALEKKVQAINRRTLEILKDGGVISEEFVSKLKTKYKNHVPLNRIMAETDDFAGALSGKGYDVKSSGIFAAKGSQRKVSDILGNVVHNYEQAVIRSEKNLVDQATLNFVRQNKDILGDSFEIIKPRAIGKTFGENGKLIMEKTNDPSILQMFENGKKIWIKVKDPKLAMALRGVNRGTVPPVLRAVASFTRLYSGLMTRFNPEFALPNKIRDLQEVMVYLSSQKGVGVKGAAGVVAKDVKSVPDVIAFLRGKDTPGARLYKEMKELGGTTGGMGLSTRKQTELSIEKLEKLANSKTKNIAENLVGYIDNLNMIFEDSTRLSVYKQALSQGLSKERAAFLAKEASINFNRMGTGGPVINALWMFSNASIQGTVKMLRSLKNPKTLGIVATTVGSAVAATNSWNDDVDPEWREKVSKWDRLNSLVVMLPNTDGQGADYFTIPVSWGIKPIKVMADYAYDAASGQEFNARTAMNDLSAAILNAYNPVGGTNFVSAVMPTIGDVPADIAMNLSWTGNKIRPDFDPNAPKDIQYYSSLGDTKTGQVAISISEMLQKHLKIAVSPADIKYAFDQYIGGIGRTVEKTGNTVAGLATGDVPDLDEFPIVSRFYRSRTEEEVALNSWSAATTAKVKGQLQEQSRDRFKIKNEAEKLYDELRRLPVAEANARAAALKKTDNLLYVKLKETMEEKKLGLSYTERLMKQLGVTNGERAKFVYEEIMKMPRAERNAYYADLKKKKVITDTVDKQLKQLLNNNAKITK